MIFSEQYDCFTFFTIRDFSECRLKQLLVKLYGLLTGVGNEEKVIVFNIGALIKDVSQLKDIMEAEGANIHGLYADVYKYLRYYSLSITNSMITDHDRACTASESQAKSLTNLNIELQKFHDSKYPLSKILIGSLLCAPIILVTSGSLPWTFGSFGVLFSLDAVWCSGYETKKRKYILDYIERMNDQEIPGMLTHLYRLQDHFKRHKSIKYSNTGTAYTTRKVSVK